MMRFVAAVFALVTVAVVATGCCCTCGAPTGDTGGFVTQASVNHARAEVGPVAVAN